MHRGAGRSESLDLGSLGLSGMVASHPTPALRVLGVVLALGQIHKSNPPVRSVERVLGLAAMHLSTCAQYTKLVGCQLSDVSGLTVGRAGRRPVPMSN